MEVRVSGCRSGGVGSQTGADTMVPLMEAVVSKPEEVFVVVVVRN